MKKIFTLFSASVSILLCACAPNFDPVSEIPDTTWTPIYTEGAMKGVEIPDDPNNPVFIHFGKDLKVNGMAGVNNFFGACELSKETAGRSECKVRWSPLGTTRMAGPYLEYESKFLKDIRETDSIRMSANKLEFLKGRKLLVEFKRIPNFQNRPATKQAE